jgi:glycosyltransferase involved in cell wall biosynthesis
MNKAMAPRHTKVVHLTSVHEANDLRIAQKECATLAQEGYDVVVIAPGRNGDLPRDVRHRVVPVPTNRFERFTRTMWQVFAAARLERAQVYHFHDPELIAVGMALRLCGAHVIFDVHEDIPLDIKTKPWIPSWLRPPVSMFARLALRLVQGCFTAIVPATPSIAQSFSHRRVVVVRNYPRLSDLLSEQEPVPFAERAPNAIYIGSVTAIRGIEQMVAAIVNPNLPKAARLTLAGPFEDEALRRRISLLAGWPRVDALGRLGRRELAAALARAQVGLLLLLPEPSFVHSLPTKLFEYLGVGLPIIASKFIVACCDVVERYECGVLVDPRDVDEVASALQRIFSNADRAQEMGERGRAALRGRYEWSSEARNLLGLYAEIAP